MRPIGCGHALLASEAMNAFGLSRDRAALLRPGFTDDVLLSDISGELDIFARVLCAKCSSANY